MQICATPNIPRLTMKFGRRPLPNPTCCRGSPRRNADRPREANLALAQGPRRTKLECMSDFTPTERTQVKRLPKRGKYERETVLAILDAGFVCHVGFSVDGQPYVIPTNYGRSGDTIYLHGSAASRMLRTLSEGVPVSVAVTHVDGLVLARPLEEVSAKVRTGGPIDDEEDYALPVWAGVLPLETVAKEPLPDAQRKKDEPVPAY